MNLKPHLEKLETMFAAKKKDAADPKKPKENSTKSKFAEAFNFDVRFGEVPRYFSGAIIEKAISSFDKSILVIISVSWLVTLIAMGVAFLGVREAAEIKVKIDTAKGLEPILPKVNRTFLGKDQYEALTVRLRKQFPDIRIEVTNKPSLRIYASSPDSFISWLNAVSYTDSMVPSIRWTLSDLCVGAECPGEFVMSAEAIAESINITPPELKY